MSGLLIIGAGGNGRVIADLASNSARWDRIEFLDDDPEVASSSTEFPVIGGCDEFESLASRFDGVVIGFGDNRTRSQWHERVRAHGCPLPCIIAPSATVSDRCSTGPGCVVMPQAVVNVGAVLGACVLINTAATVDHDCVLGDSVHVSPGANLGGEVRVGPRSWLGIGCSVRHSIRIGSDVVVGAGASVVCDLEDGVTVVGVPARPIPAG